MDLTAGEVRKAGVRQKLAGQPFQVLQALLERPGEIVTRNELRQRIWPDNTVVDHDLALRKAINRLREVLGDSSDNPRFIETLSRRGYRFLVPVMGENEKDQSVRLPRAGDASITKNRNVTAGIVAALAFVLGGITALMLLRQPRVLSVGQFVRLTNDGRDKSGNLSDGIPSPVLTDGTRLFFVERNVGFSELVQVSSSGGDALPVPSPFRSVRLAAISPDCAHLLIGNAAESPTAVEQPFYTLPAIGGSAIRQSDFVAHDGSWSPNGLSMVYATADTLMIGKADGSAATKLVGGLGAISWPRWSPHSERLRFTVTHPGTKDNTIWEIRTDGTQLREVSRDWNLTGDQCCGSWTPDGKYFVFESAEWSGTSLWAVAEATLVSRNPRPVQLASGPVWASAPTVSSDGKKLFFIGFQPRTETMRYDWKEKRFVPFLPGISVDAVDITRDGNWITFTQYPEGSLWRVRADGSERVRLTSGGVYGFRPRWSPDGKNIVFFGPYPHHPWKLYLLPSSGGTPAQLIPDNGNEGDPTWSPDGTKIAFGRLPWMMSAAEQPRLYVLDLKSKQTAPLPGSDGLFSPRWSPSGRYLVALTADSARLMIYDFQTQEWQVLAQGSFGNPEWSNDGAWLYALDARSMTLVRIRTDNGQIDTVVNLSRERVASTITGMWIGVAPDGSLLAIRDLSTHEIYSSELARE